MDTNLPILFADLQKHLGLDMAFNLLLVYTGVRKATMMMWIDRRDPKQVLKTVTDHLPDMKSCPCWQGILFTMAESVPFDTQHCSSKELGTFLSYPTPGQQDGEWAIHIKVSNPSTKPYAIMSFKSESKDPPALNDLYEDIVPIANQLGFDTDIFRQFMPHTETVIDAWLKDDNSLFIETGGDLLWNMKNLLWNCGWGILSYMHDKGMIDLTTIREYVADKARHMLIVSTSDADVESREDKIMKKIATVVEDFADRITLSEEFIKSVKDRYL